MKTKGTGLAFIYFVFIITVSLITLPLAYGAFFYKSYIIRYDRGWNILCDPYVVKKDDWIFKLFRQKGEISHRDFPEFLRIFKRLNPHIHDIDRIRPGQHIVIPLKKVDRDTLSENSSDVVTIPYLTSVTMPETTTINSTDYSVKNGDCVSILISKTYGDYGTKSYKNGEKLFRLMNPQVKDLDLIYAGQVLRLPIPEIQSPSWSQSSFDNEATHDTPGSPDRQRASDERTQAPSVEENSEEPSGSSLSEVASILDAELFSKGNYYLPRPGQDDFELDLTRFPFIKLEDGTRIFFSMGAENQGAEITMLKSFWEDVHIIKVARGDSMEQVLDSVFASLQAGVFKHRLSFSDHGVDVEVRGKWIIEKPREDGEAIRHLCITLIDDYKERTPAPIVRYLDQNNIVVKDILIGKRYTEPKSHESRYNITAKRVDIIDPSDHKAFVNDLLVAMGYQYSPNTNISFEYAGVQINAASNFAAKNDGNIFWVDFGNFYGDAVHAIEKSGYPVVQIKDNDTLDDIIQKLLGAMGIPFKKAPTFLAAQRPSGHNIKLTIPGFLTDDTVNPGTLLTLAPLHNRIVQFLSDKGTKIIRIDVKGKKNE